MSSGIPCRPSQLKSREPDILARDILIISVLSWPFGAAAALHLLLSGARCCLACRGSREQAAWRIVYFAHQLWCAINRLRRGHTARIAVLSEVKHQVNPMAKFYFRGNLLMRFKVSLAGPLYVRVLPLSEGFCGGLSSILR